MNTFGHIPECLVPVFPGCHRLGIFRQPLELAERCPMPIARTQDDRDHRRLAPVVTFDGPFHLDIVAVVRRKERRADQQEDNPCRFEPAVNFALPFLTCTDHPVVPARNKALSTKD